MGSGGLGGTPSHPQRIVGCVPRKLCVGSWHLGRWPHLEIESWQVYMVNDGDEMAAA